MAATSRHSSQEGEAKDYAAKVHIDVKKGMHTAPCKSITVAEAADKWINGVGADGRERSTIEQYRQHAKIHILPGSARPSWRT